MTRLIAAVDNSPAARPVCEMAKVVARVFGAQCVSVHVREDGHEPARAAASHAGVPFEVLEGDPLAAICALGAQDDVVAMAVGAHGRSAVRGPVGHLPLELAGRTDKPVLVVPPTCRAPSRIQRVLVAMKGTPEKRISLKRAVQLAAASDLQIVVVHVDDESTIPAFSDQVQHETEAYAQEFFARNIPGTAHARLELRIGVPAEEILDVARTSRSEVLAIGWSHHGDPERGTVARQLLERCELPILLVGTG